MSLLLFGLLNLGIYGGCILNEQQVVQSIIQKQVEQNKKDWPVDVQLEQVAKENEAAFNKLK